jgi:hypothetical protein
VKKAHPKPEELRTLADTLSDLGFHAASTSLRDAADGLEERSASFDRYALDLAPKFWAGCREEMGKADHTLSRDFKDLPEYFCNGIIAGIKSLIEALDEDGQLDGDFYHDLDMIAPPKAEKPVPPTWANSLKVN